ncbi:MAG: hypothetical protein AAFQ80_24135 [Cyanobacteria bacterium J06621_8]
MVKFCLKRSQKLIVLWNNELIDYCKRVREFKNDDCFRRVTEKGYLFYSGDRYVSFLNKTR